MAATLLLADDSITIQRVIELTFADEHVRVIAASDGQQAIQRIDHEPPDIILADVGMPKLDGYGVATYVKQTPSLKHIPVLLLTGAFEPIDEAKARATGCDGVLVKPFEPEKLIARVKELLAGSRHADLWPADLPRVEAPASPVNVAPASPVIVAPAPPVNVPPAPPAPPAMVVRTAPVIAAPVAAAPAPVQAPPPVSIRHTEPVVTKMPVAAPVPVRAPEPPPMPAPLAPRPAAQSTGPVFLDTPNHAASRPAPPARPQPQRAPEMPPPADAFESELDMLDVALSRLEPTASPQELDAATASDFARDLAALRNVGPDEAFGDERPGDVAPSFGNWDLSAGRGSAPAEPIMDLGIDLEEHEPIDVVPIEVPADVVPASVAPVPALAAVPEPAVILPPVVAPPVVPPPAPPAAPVFVTPAPAPPPVIPAAVPAPVAAPAPVETSAPIATPAPIVAAAPVVMPAPAAPPPVVQISPRAPVVPAYVPPTPVAPPPPPQPKPTLAGAFSALLAAERAQPTPAAVAATAAVSEAAIEEVVKRVLARMTDEAVHRVVLDAAERIIREEIEHLKAPDSAKPR